MKKKGFTLIELLAVIIVLAIIALIATPKVLDIINDVRNSANKSSAYMVLDAARNYYAESMLDNSKKENLTGITNLLDSLSLENKPKQGVVYINDNGQIAMALVFDKTCYIKNFRTSNIVESNDINNCKTSYTDVALNGADPELEDGMIPVIIASDGSLTKADTRLEWYNYSNKLWANVVLVSEDVRNEYMNAEAGTTINLNKVLAYYVWVPRYRYEIFNTKEDIKTNQTYGESAVQLINIVFEDKYTEKSTGSNKGEYVTHPAFTFGSDEVNGIWVGKFETTGDSTKPTILPNVSSLRSQNVSTKFKTSLLFANNTLNGDGSITHTNNNVYGINEMDAHMMKNLEWGAVAYLTTSIYGQGLTEVRINNSSSYITGCAATKEAVALPGDYTDYVSGCENAYNTEIGVLASTTGNITGIYDMSGGAWEYMMAVMEDANGSGVPASGRSNIYNSGFTGNFTCPTCDNNDGSITSLTGVTYPDSKYYDLYAYGTSVGNAEAYNRGQLGDATYELGNFTSAVSTSDNSRRYYSNWNGDYAYFVDSGYPWFARGGHWSGGSGSGVFAFYNDSGRAGSYFSFRSVLLK